MDFNLKEVRLFATEQEKQKAKQERLSKEMTYGNPEDELGGLYQICVWGAPVFHFITAASTAAFVFRVMESHMRELIGYAGTVISFITAALCAYVIERILSACWKPAFKKLFVSGKMDITLFGFGAIFTVLTMVAALSGVAIISENTMGEMKIESVMASSQAHEKSLTEIDSEISRLNSGKVKGYNWKGNPTEKAIARVKQLQLEKEGKIAAFKSLADATAQANNHTATSYSDKLKKVQGYLGYLAIFAEIIKLILYSFLGYWSLQLAKWHGGEREKTVIPQYNHTTRQNKAQYEEVEPTEIEEKDTFPIESTPQLDSMSQDMILAELSKISANQKTYRSKYERGEIKESTYIKNMIRLGEGEAMYKKQLETIYRLASK
jgi:hypothetical protein